MKQQIATMAQHSDAQKAWAVSMYRNSVPSSEVSRRTGIPANYVRTLAKRMPEQVLEADEALEVAVSENETPAPSSVKPAETPRFKLTVLDVVFYATTLTACAGLVTLLRWWGLPVALVYSLILVDAMNKAKDVRLENSARMGAAMVVVFEILAACIHTYLFNLVLWANYKMLPWDMSQKIVNGVWIWPNDGKPFAVAVGIAVVLSGSAIYAIENSIVTARERARIAEK